MSQEQNAEELIIQYKKLLQKLPKEIDRSGLKNDYLIKQSKIPRSTYFRKLKQKNFDPDEALSLFRVINR